ncbi:MAG: hypothetical protein WD468_10015, partial [Pirellulales bacterium]
GDMNFDGITNLSDAYLFNSAWVTATGSFLALDQLLHNVPEPGSLALYLFAVVLTCPNARRRT